MKVVHLFKMSVMETLLLSMTTHKAWILYIVGTSFCLLVFSSYTCVLVLVCASHVTIWTTWQHPARSHLRTISMYCPRWNIGHQPR